MEITPGPPIVIIWTEGLIHNISYNSETFAKDYEATIEPALVFTTGVPHTGPSFT